MLLHLGGDWAANTRRVVAILDYSTVCGNRSFKKLIRQAEERGQLESIDEGSETRSLIVLQTERGTRLVLSPISATALKGRAQSSGLLLDFHAAAHMNQSRKGR